MVSFFNNKKFVAVFLLIIALIVIVASLSVKKMTDLNEQYYYSMEESMESMRVISTLRYLTENMIATSQRHIAEMNPLWMDIYEDEMVEIEIEIANLMKQLEARIEPEKKRGLYLLFEHKWKDYRRLQELAMQASRANEDVKAQTVARDARRQYDVTQAYFRQLNDLYTAKINKEYAIQREEMLRATVNHTLALIVLFIGIGLAIAYTVRKLVLQEKEKRTEMEDKYSKLIENSPDTIIITSRESITYTNPAGVRLLGARKEQELVGKEVWGFFAEPDMKERYQDLFEDGGLVSQELSVTTLDGREITLEITVTTLDEQQEMLQIIARDMTEKKQAQEQINVMAFHDALTNLPNRRLFNENLLTAIEEAKTTESELAVLFIDLDRFKLINDTLGHYAGDRLLQLVAVRLGKCLQAGDVICRQGGDEFLLLLRHTTTSSVKRTTKAILEGLRQPFIIEGQECYITPSIGIATYPDQGNTPKELLKHADIAMYNAKENGKNCYRFFNDEMKHDHQRAVEIEQKLRKAIEHNDLTLHYQPKVDSHSNQLIGTEALLRWNDAKLGIVSPVEFISIAEETGLIIEIGEWVIRQACQQIRTWQEAGLNISVAVNVSPVQFQQDVVSIIASALETNKIDPKRLEIEITESSIVDNHEDLIEKLTQLKQIGVKVTIDDFGTGYSSLSYLKLLPISALKIDRTFVRDILDDHNDAEIVSTIIKLSHSLKLDVVAEGVETIGQLEFLKRHNCHLIQGYYFSKPLPVDEFEEWLQGFQQA